MTVHTQQTIPDVDVQQPHYEPQDSDVEQRTLDDLVKEAQREADKHSTNPSKEKQ